MTDKPALRTKTDVLDLVINFMMDHEKQMDQMLERLERLTDKLSSKGAIQEPMTSTVETPKNHTDRFIITVDNPKKYGPMKSIKIDWENRERDLDTESPEVLKFLEEIEEIYRES